MRDTWLANLGVRMAILLIEEDYSRDDLRMMRITHGVISLQLWARSLESFPLACASVRAPAPESGCADGAPAGY